MGTINESFWKKKKPNHTHTHTALGLFGTNTYLDVVIFVSMPTPPQQLCSSRRRSQIVDDSPDGVGRRDALKTVRGARAINPSTDGRTRRPRKEPPPPQNRKGTVVPLSDERTRPERERRVRTLQVPAPRRRRRRRGRRMSGVSGRMKNSLEDNANVLRNRGDGKMGNRRALMGFPIRRRERERIVRYPHVCNAEKTSYW